MQCLGTSIPEISKILKACTGTAAGAIVTGKIFIIADFIQKEQKTLSNQDDKPDVISLIISKP